jgi:predicted phosphodiesterase
MRILVISDIHANFTALEAVIKDAGSFDQVWCLGDIVGYGPEPNECINRLREFDLICLAGNHDLAVVGRIALWDFTPDAQEVIFWTRHWLTTLNLDWLLTLPNTPLVPEQDITLVHGSPRDPVWGYITEKDEAKANLDLITTPFCLTGHTHIPVIYRKPWDDPRVLEEWPRVNSAIRLTLDRMFINPGSVGQPRDEDPRAAYATIDMESMTFTYRRVEYDVTSTQKLMKQAKFPNRLIRRLRFGQ